MPRSRKQQGQQGGDVALSGLATESKRVPFTWLKPAPYNARRLNQQELHSICASIHRFGLVDPFIARAEDGLLVAGHQRRQAVQYMLDGKYTVDSTGRYKAGGTPVKLTLPEGAVLTVLVKGLSDDEAKRLNLALNRVGGSWDDDKLADLIKELAQGGAQDLFVTGFSDNEIATMIKGDEPGQVPAPAGRVPKLTLEFSSKESRDAVKALIVGKSKQGELAGDTLAKMVIRPKKQE